MTNSYAGCGKMSERFCALSFISAEESAPAPPQSLAEYLSAAYSILREIHAASGVRTHVKDAMNVNARENPMT